MADISEMLSQLLSSDEGKQQISQVLSMLGSGQQPAASSGAASQNNLPQAQSETYSGEVYNGVQRYQPRTGVSSSAGSQGGDVPAGISGGRQSPHAHAEEAFHNTQLQTSGGGSIVENNGLSGQAIQTALSGLLGKNNSGSSSTPDNQSLQNMLGSLLSGSGGNSNGGGGPDLSSLLSSLGGGGNGGGGGNSPDLSSLLSSLGGGSNGGGGGNSPDLSSLLSSLGGGGNGGGGGNSPDLSSLLSSLGGGGNGGGGGLNLSSLLSSLGGGNNSGGGSALPNLDFGKLLRVQQLLSQRRDNGSTSLLRALKPHLNEENRKKADEAARILELLELLPLIKESGLLGSLLGGDSG